MKNWLRGPLQPWMREFLAPRRIRGRGWFDRAEVGRLMDEHLQGSYNHAHRLWCLIALEPSLTSLKEAPRARALVT